MKLQEKPYNIKKIGITNESKYTIEANPIAFEILSSKLYKNSFLACQRELCANAIDAHIEAGNPNTPIEVHIPTRFEPYFSVRDFGNGLNKEDLVYLYTTYFSSNKRMSDDQVGGFGIGACSSWAVTDSFTVTSINKGTKYSYLMFKGEDRTPNYSLIKEESTNEPSGMEIKIGVKDSDIQKYSDDAASIYRFYKIKPKFSGAVPHINNPTVNLKGSNWYTTEQYSPYGYNRIAPIVVMGQIGYPFDISLLKNVGETCKKICNCGLIVEVDIGSLEPSASREELSYTKNTVANLESALSQIEIEYAATVQKDIDNAPNYYEACVLAAKMPIFPNKAMYKGRQIDTQQKFKFDDPITKFTYKGYGKRKYYIENYNGDQTLGVGFMSKVYEKDVDQTSHLRASQHAESSRGEVWLVNPKELTQLCDKFGYPLASVPKVSSLPYTPVAGKKSTKVTGIYTIDNAGWHKASVDFKTEPTGYYVGFFDKYFYDPGLVSKYTGPFCWRYLEQYLVASNLKVPKTYGVQKDKMPKFVKQGWTNLFEKVKSDIDALDSDPEFEKFWSYENADLDFRTIKLCEGLSKQSNLTSVLEDFQREYLICANIHERSAAKYKALIQIDSIFYKTLQPKKTNTITPLFDKVLKEYDLLLTLILGSIHPARIIKYIRDTDLLKKGKI